jgi:hypothetical protein
MPMALPNNAGRYLRRIAQDAKWARDGKETIPPMWAEELEDTLQFLDGHNQLECRLSRLRGKWRELVAELAEARTGRFLANLGFQILGWQPPSPTGCPGDLLVRWGAAAPVFVEVKAPDWEGEFQGELENEEFQKRKTLGKYVDNEGGAASPTEIPFRVIRENALKKFADDRPNMAVVVDDLRISPAEARGMIEDHVKQFFQEPQTVRLGAILFVCVEHPAGEPARYLSNFYENRSATSACQLPEAAVAVLTARAERDSSIVQAEAGKWAGDRQGALEDLARRLCRHDYDPTQAGA